MPIKLEQKKINILIKLAEDKKILSINLEQQKIIFEEELNFEIDSFRKKCLLEGLDDIALTFKKIKKIKDFEIELKKNKPWII